ncbi:5'(3')-deoxyribonucleotidase, mitochondrial isoform X8 [Rhinolophus ferrumequinum]|uniref:5'(3')-deoxyribonucleotidase, mitochondrial isoform X8 n=1 Tax=Rhinolophus ferrumequinum TaxID=59479 RepID=UPI00140FA8AD|nr:5'(3')-deoxyribonucleotidase, mitochondrial isoform X8 [Rhinolophus ferrumequinum]
MIRLRGWCAPRPRGSAVPGARRWAAGGPAGAMGGRALRVLVDMDGVLADFEGGFLKKFRARFPDQPFIALEDRRGFWLSEQYGRLQPGLSEKAISIWESENFFFDLEPLPGAVEAVKQMASLENTAVFICTSPIKKYKYCPYEKTGAGPRQRCRNWVCVIGNFGGRLTRMQHPSTWLDLRSYRNISPRSIGNLKKENKWSFSIDSL